MPLDPTVNAKIDALVADLRAKQQSFSDASDANDQAQAVAQSAVAAAAGTSQAKTAAHDDMDQSIDSLVSFVQGLK